MKYIFFSIIFLSLIYLNLKDKSYNDNILLFGSSLPQSGIMKAWASSIYSGANSYFFYANEKHLLRNHSIKLISYDDKYEPELTLENINKLIFVDKVFSLFAFVGTPTIKNVLNIIEDENIPFIAPFSGAEFLRNKHKKNIINYRSSYKEEVENIVSYLYEKKKIKKISIFYQNDNYGEEAYLSLLESLEKRDLHINSEGTYKRNTLSIKHAFYEIKEGKPEAIILVGAYKANALFIKKAKNDQVFKNTIFCNISFGDANEIIKELKSQTKNLIFSSVVPFYKSNEIPVIVEYQDLMKKYFPKQALGFVSLESFLAAKSIVEALRQIKGNITRNNFIEAFNHMNNNFLDGIKTKYKNSQIQDNTYLFTYENNTFKKIK